MQRESIVIEKAKNKDVEEVYAIEKESFKDPWNKFIFYHELKNPVSLFYVAKKDEKVVGYIIAWIVGDEMHILNVAVKREERRKRIGSFLMRKIISEASEKNVKRIYLEVRVSNHPAINFYKKEGFKIIYTRKHYYRNGEDAYVMVKDV